MHARPRRRLHADPVYVPDSLKMVENQGIEPCLRSLPAIAVAQNVPRDGVHGETRTHRLLVLNQQGMPIPFTCTFGAQDWTRTSTPGPYIQSKPWWRISDSNRSGYLLAKQIRVPCPFPIDLSLLRIRGRPGENRTHSKELRRLHAAPPAGLLMLVVVLIWRKSRESNPRLSQAPTAFQAVLASQAR